MNFSQLFCYLSRIKEIVFLVYPSCDSSKQTLLTILLALTKSDFPTICLCDHPEDKNSPQELVSWPHLLVAYQISWVNKVCVFCKTKPHLIFGIPQYSHIEHSSGHWSSSGIFICTGDGMLFLYCWHLWKEGNVRSDVLMVCGWLAYEVRITSQLRILQTDRQAGLYTHVHMRTCARAHKP